MLYIVTIKTVDGVSRDVPMEAHGAHKAQVRAKRVSTQGVLSKRTIRITRDGRLLPNVTFGKDELIALVRAWWEEYQAFAVVPGNVSDDDYTNAIDYFNETCRAIYRG